MPKKDVSVEILGVKFRNPIIPGASNVVLDARGVRKCIEQGVGGIVVKSFTSIAPMRTKARPYHFNAGVFGKGLDGYWVSARDGYHVLSCEEAAGKLLPEMVRLCGKAGIPLVINLTDGPDVEQWVRDARRFEEVGAVMLELNFASPVTPPKSGQAFPSFLGEDISLCKRILRSLKEVVHIPIGAELSIMWSSFVEQAKSFAEAGADFLTCSNIGQGLLIDVDAEVPFGNLGGGGYPLGHAFLPYNLWRVVQVRKMTDVPIIGYGGVNNASDALMYLLAGCHLVEVSSAIHRYGYRLFGEIIKGVGEWMERKGYSSVEDFRGKVFDLASKASSPSLIEMEFPFPMPQEKSSPVIPMIERERCSLCGHCEDFCLSGVFKIEKAEKRVDIDHEKKCWGCGDCVGWCPEEAIMLIDKETKEVVWDNRGLARPYRPEKWKKGK